MKKIITNIDGILPTSVASIRKTGVYRSIDNSISVNGTTHILTIEVYRSTTKTVNKGESQAVICNNNQLGEHNTHTGILPRYKYTPSVSHTTKSVNCE